LCQHFNLISPRLLGRNCECLSRGPPGHQSIPSRVRIPGALWMQGFCPSVMARSEIPSSECKKSGTELVQY
jgi:hypothetical protein